MHPPSCARFPGDPGPWEPLLRPLADTTTSCRQAAGRPGVSTHPHCSNDSTEGKHSGGGGGVFREKQHSRWEGTMPLKPISP